MLYVGIDVAKDKHDCCIIDSDGVIHTNELVIGNSKEGFETLLSTITSLLPDKNFNNVRIGLEATGHYSINISSYLYSKGLQLTTLNPLATSLFRKAQTLRKTKTDKCDAKFIARMLLTDDSESYSPTSYQIQELKSLARQRFRLVSHRSKFKISINRLVDITFPELATMVNSIHQTSSYALLSEFSCPKAIAGCHLTKLTNLLLKASRGKYGKEKAIAIKDIASKSIGNSNRSTQLELVQNICFIRSLDIAIREVDKLIKIIIDDMKSPVLSIPGISYTLAAHIIAEIGDITRFSSPAKLLAFAGLEPSIYQSGKFNATNTSMVKRGSTYLRWAVMNASRYVSMRDPTFAAYLSKKRLEGKHYFVALSHVSRKLLRVIFHLLYTNSTFVPQS